MEVLNNNVTHLSNFEVMNHLQNIKRSRQKHKGQLATITYETLKYLNNSSCKSQTAESVQNCLKDLKKFNLTQNEKLMLINVPPTTPLEIQLMIEESEERLTEKQVEEILQIIAKNFPHFFKQDLDSEDVQQT